MSTLRDFLLEAHEQAKAYKTKRVLENGAQAPMAFVVVANRGSELVAMFYPRDRDDMLWVTRLAIGAFGCDRVAGSTDAYIVLSSAQRPDVAHINPDTKQPWRAGDLERAFRKQRPWVGESLTTHALDKVEQQQLLLTQTYAAKHHKIRWMESKILGDDNCQLEGVIPDALEQALHAPDLMAAMSRIVPDLMGLTPAAARAHADVVAIRMCVAQKIPVLYNTSDPDVRGILEMSLGDQERNAAMGAPGVHLQTIIPSLHNPWKKQP